MFNFERLEKKCKKYRLKRYFPFIISIFFVIFIFIYIMDDFSEKSFEEKKAVEFNKSKKSELIKKEPNIHIENSAQKIVKKLKKGKFANSEKKCYALQFLESRKKYLSDIKKIEDNLESYGLECYLKFGSIDSDKVYLRCNKVENYEDLNRFIDLAKEKNLDYFVVKESCEPLKKVKDVKEEKSVIIEEKNISLKNAQKTEKENSANLEQNRNILNIKEPSIKDLEELFQKRKTYKLAIKIAKYYFEKRDYRKSLEWAKTANTIDNESEESWLLYAKSLYHLGDKESAIELLQVYLKFKHSKDAAKLLEQWMQNDS
ncbi:tetratricopeptide repeat protein [Nitrosophilus labii]|uniref:tetratricopeptide repeat protein n=1 Tax=Nitrosophilus labii TaxID=2706014 RepID=UPI001656E1B5|nr:tetratricopeptide repeat protein [Nitrosophilus labii]